MGVGDGRQGGGESGKIFFGQLLCKFLAFSGENHVKFDSFINFSGKSHVKFGHFVFFSYIF